MNLGLQNKVVLVTGSGRGLGKAIVEVLVEEGAKVVVTDRNGRSAATTASQFPKGSILALSGDFTQRAVIRRAVKNTLKTFGSIDVVVANLGSGRGANEWRLGEKEWERVIALNLDGARRITEEVVSHMTKGGGGTIVYVASIAGIAALGAPVHYSVAKSALISYSKNLSRRLARWNIRVNTVCPGNILFPGGTWDKKLRQRRKQVIEMIKRDVPLNRFAAAREIADVVVFLASERASFMTGSCVIVDGGQTSQII